MTTKTELLNIIRSKCIDCSGGELKEVRLCPCTGCALHPFRMAQDPNPARKGQRVGRVEREICDDMDGDHASALASAGFGTDEDYGGAAPEDWR